MVGTGLTLHFGICRHVPSSERGPSHSTESARNVHPRGQQTTGDGEVDETVATRKEIKKEGVRRERLKLLRQVTDVLDEPMTVLAFVWLALLIYDFTYGLGRVGTIANNVIWGLFVVHFLLEFTLAPQKWAYLEQNWITAVALVLPALRIFRVVQAVRILTHAGRSLSLLRLLASLNRGMRALERSLGHSGLGFIFALTVLVAFAGAAGMYRFENPQTLSDAGFMGDPSFGLHSYGEAVWWTAMLLTTLGSDYFPKTNEGRTLCFLLSVYAFSIFGYITASVARILLKNKIPAAAPATAPDSSAEIAALRKEIGALRREIAERLPRS